jgi:hypothetical protein
MRNTVFPLKALSTNFGYYKWTHGPRFACDWLAFMTKLATKSLDYDLVMFSAKRNGTEMLQTFSIETGEVHKTEISVGGGRFYHEPSAMPYSESEYDTIV